MLNTRLQENNVAGLRGSGGMRTHHRPLCLDERVVMAVLYIHNHTSAACGSARNSPVGQTSSGFMELERDHHHDIETCTLALPGLLFHCLVTVLTAVPNPL
jgi:hypothetical protein